MTLQQRNFRLLILINLLFLAAVLYVNYLANALPIGGRTPAEVSEMYPTLFTPAGFTFSIWGIIYLLLLGFAVYQTGFWNQSAPGFMQRIGWLFALSCIANAGWLFAFHHLQIGLSVFIMLVLLSSLTAIYLRLGIGKTEAPAAERWLVRLPFRVYLGWITVATIANISILLTHVGWDGQPGGPVFWTLFVLAAATGIGLWAVFSRRDIAYALVLVWAFYGIYSKRLADTVASDHLIETAALAGMGILVLGMIYRLILRREIRF